VDCELTPVVRLMINDRIADVYVPGEFHLCHPFAQRLKRLVGHI
jgi:hypothetical protein